MPQTPWHLFRNSMTVFARTWSVTSGGTPTTPAVGATPTYTVKCWVQPTSASDSILYGRDTTQQLYDVYCAPVDSTGAAWDCSPKDAVYIDSVRYRPMGKPRDMVSFNCVKVLTVEVDTN